MGFPMMDTSYDLYTSVEVGEQKMDNPSPFSDNLQWTAISSASDQYITGDSYSIDPGVNGLQRRIPSHVSSSSGATSTSTDAGDAWRSASRSTADHQDLQRSSVSMSPHQRLEMQTDQTTQEPSFFPDFYTSSGSAPWPANDSMLRPGPTSPAIVSQSNRQSSSIPVGDFAQIRSPGHIGPKQRPSSYASTQHILSPETFNHRSISQPLPSPSSIGVEQSSRRPSISPTQSRSTIKKEIDSPGSANEKRRKTKPRRTAHNAIEKRYRIRLNDKIAELRDSIPSLRAQPVTNVDGIPDDEFDDSLSERPSATKVNKANILEKATEYVKHLESYNRRLEAELHRILSVSQMRQANTLPNNYALMNQGPSALLPRNLASDICTYPVRGPLPGEVFP